jgi:MarR family transcriptional regulator, organic hydroperoxide resistance regulator
MPELLDLYGTTSKAVRAATDSALRRHGLRLGQDRLLAQLWNEDGRTPGQIAHAVGVSTPAVTNAATVLAKAGLLVRRPDEHDKRLVRLWLTDAGRALEQVIERERQTLEDVLLRQISETELKHFLRVLRKIASAAAEAGKLPPAP